MPTALDALNYAKRFVGNLPVDDANLKYRLLNYAHNRLWMAAPWVWTVGSIPVQTLVNGQQDYNTGSMPTDVHSLLSVKFDDGNEKGDLVVVPSIPVTTEVGKTSQISWEGNKLRVLPVPTGYTTFPRLFSLYKKDVVPLTIANEGSDYEATFGVPNEWFWIFEELVVLRALMFSHSPRAGNVTVNGDMAQYNGQYGYVEASLKEMKKGETGFLTTIGIEVKNG